MKYPSGSINHKVPKSIPAWQAAFIEPLSCAIHAVELGNIQFNHIVVVSGCGPLGLGMVAAAKQKNPMKLIALDLFDWKLDVAKECGADIVLNPNNSDVVAEIKQMTDGYGCDIYIEATGHPASVIQGLHMTAKLGTFVEYSVFGKETTADWTIISDMKELTVQGGHLSPNCYPKAISMLSHGDLPMDKIITHKLPLEDFQKGIDLVNRSSESIKVVLFP
jgi:threonine dehydrogenase-like Zn-dependent dehydrogenase